MGAKIINLSEIGEITDKILSLKQQTPNENLIVAIAGGSATGKTSQVSKMLNDSLVFRGLDSSILSQDNFQIGRDFVDQFEHQDQLQLPPKDSDLLFKIKKYKWDLPDNFDLKSCKQALEQIKKLSAEIEIPNFQVKNANREGFKIVSVSNITLFEGIYTFFGELDDFAYDLKIYVDTPFYARFLRRYFRFVYEMQIPNPEKAIKQICTSVLFAHLDFIETQKENSDFIIKIPYNFTQTISNLKLTPKTAINQTEIETELGSIFEENFDESGKMVIAFDGEIYRFLVIHNDQVWENIPISLESKDYLIEAFKLAKIHS